MDIDVVLGSPGDQASLGPRVGLSPQAVTTASPLQMIEAILARLGPQGRIGRLRIFDFRSRGPGPVVPTAQLARLRGLFGPGGQVEIMVRPAGATGPARPGTAGGGFGGSFAGAGQFNGGFQGFGGFGGGALAGLDARHLAGLLSVPVQVREL